MNKYLIIAVCSFFASCDYRLINEYKEQHDKYRTLMYRSGFKQCFVDSCRKYGLLYQSAIGYEDSNNKNWLDTIPVTENYDCK